MRSDDIRRLGWLIGLAMCVAFVACGLVVLWWSYFGTAA